ncbi:MAG TPA: S24/S26 family peptidase [Thermoanaerobaculia bacterium]|nr:S24/S26 family peptidase [Thermoanaerobaculia bacterium]
MKTFTAVRALAAEGAIEATVRGSSMAPLLVDGDRVAIAGARIYLPGEVIAFRGDDGRLVVHRLLGFRLYRGRLACITRGDAASQPDAPVPLPAILGRVVAHPGRGALVSWRARCGAAAGYLRLAAGRLRRRFAGSSEAP